MWEQEKMLKNIIVIGLLSCCGFGESVQAEAIIREATGVVTPKRSVVLDAKVVGRITATYIEEGEAVKKDQVLVQLDDAEWRADVSSAQAGLNLAIVERDYRQKVARRTKNLAQKKTVTQELQDEADFAFASSREKVKQAEAAVAKSRAILREAEIHAPFDGVVITKSAEPGLLTQPGSSLITLEDHQELKIRARIKEQDIPYLKWGQIIEVVINALSDLHISAEVIRIIPSGDMTTHEFIIDALLPSHEGLLPGMFGRLRFKGE
jgi:RND family efflux transporter MFP subunit